MDKKFRKSIEIARALKPRYRKGRCHHVSVIFNKNKILAIGVNNYQKTHPKTLNYKYLNKENNRYIPGLHSEMAGLLKLGYEDCSNLIIINVRIGNNGKILNSRFCSGCESLVKQANFKAAFYSNDNGEFCELI